MMERTQFTFYESFRRALARIKKNADRALAYDAIADYALYGTEPDLEKLPDAAALAFDLIRPNLDASRRKATSGKVGGERKQSQSKAEAKHKQTGSEKEGEREGEKEKEIEIEKENECYTPKPPKGANTFIPPTVDEVAAYCLERNNGIAPQNFVDYYAQQKWKLSNGNPMTDWKAAVRTWENRDKSRKTARRDTGGNIFMEMLEEERER